MVNNKLLIALSFFVAFFNCKENSKKISVNKIDYKDFKNAEELRSSIESFYIYNNQTLPKNEKQLKEFYQDSLNYLFENKESPIGIIHYIPAFKEKNGSPSEYFLVTDNVKINSLKQNEIDSFLAKLVTICEYNKGNKKDLLLSYGNPYLVSSSRAAFPLKQAQSAHWKNRVFFNVIFSIDSNLVMNNDKLDFTFQKDSITIYGTFFNNNVKEKVLALLRDDKNVEVQGFKTKNVNENEFILKDVVFKVKRDSIYGTYFNEVGELRNYKHIRDCDSILQ